MLEFGTLSKLTGKPVFYDKAKRALVETFKRRSSIDLVGSTINVETGAWTDPEVTSRAASIRITNILEMLAPVRRQRILEMWQASVPAINKYLADEVRGELWYGHADITRGNGRTPIWRRSTRSFRRCSHCRATSRARERLQDSSFKMWNLHGIEPEIIDYRTMQIVSTAIISGPRSSNRHITCITSRAIRNI